jgi:thioredoxin 1
MSANILEITDNTFDAEVNKSEKPVIVDFWAPWCGPCRAIGPILEELSGSYKEKVKFAKCNVDDNPVSPGNYAVRAIPTLLFVKNGKVVETITGMVAKGKLEEAIKTKLL